MKKSLSQKLLSYSALATAGLLSTQRSDGQIVYTDINDTTITQSSEGHFHLDLNNDGITDFIIYTGGLEFAAVRLEATRNPYNSVMAATQSSSMVLPYKLNFLDPVSSLQHFLPANAFLDILASTFVDNGNWVGARDKYLGLKFQAGTNNYFGWVRLNVDKNVRNFTVKDYAYNSVAGRTILAGDEGCSDNYEPNDSRKQATPIRPNTLIRAQIAAPGDRDWYSFAVSGDQNNVRIILSSLLFDYDIRLADQQGNLLAQSKNTGDKNDTIIYNGLPRGNFYVKVYGRNGSYSDVDCYSLMVETSANAFKEMEQQNLTDELSTLHVFPNPFSSSTNIQFSLSKNSSVEISLIDLEGRKIRTIAKGDFEEGDHEIVFRKEDITPGAYLLQLRSENEVTTSKLIVE